jgi:murein DD-endopeptidase MepM/ murein hydrolase activator NlpD
MDKKKTTIIVIGYEGESVKTIQISTHFIQNIKKYLAASGTLFSIFVLLLTASFLHFSNVKVENNNLSSKLNNMTREMRVLDSLQLTEKINNIDLNLSQINNYLITRGIINIPNQGGEVSSSHHDDFSKVNSLEDQSEIFLTSLKSIPLGIPYEGSLSSGYGYRSNPFGGFSGEFHPGVDFKGPYGVPITATADGIVERNDWYGGYGNAVVIGHEFGYSTLYGHLSRVNVQQGQSVKAGDVIGFLGSTGRSTGPHVHYEIRKNGSDIDPLPFLKINL